MGVDHLAHVHLVNVVPAEDGDDVRAFVGDDVLALVDGVRRALEPTLAGALLGLEERSLDEQLALEAQIQADCVCSADFREGLDAVQKKRRAVFRGK